MLQAEHICCGYGGEPVVRDVSFSVKPGEHLCIMGPNGCGKTTLLRALAGLLPWQGSITIAGQDLRGMNRRQIARNVAMMSQLTSVYFSYTVYETVMLGRYAHRSPGALQGADRQDREIVLDCLERTGLLPLADRPITRWNWWLNCAVGALPVTAVWWECFTTSIWPWNLPTGCCCWKRERCGEFTPPMILIWRR